MTLKLVPDSLIMCTPVKHRCRIVFQRGETDGVLAFCTQPGCLYKFQTPVELFGMAVDACTQHTHRMRYAVG